MTNSTAQSTATKPTRNNSNTKEGFILYKSFYVPIKELSREEKGELLDVIFQHQINPESQIKFESERVKIAFSFFVNQFRLDNEKYEEVKKIRSEIGKRGGTASAKSRWGNLSKSKQSNQLVQKVSKVTDKDKDKEKEKDKITSKNSLIALTSNEKIKIALDHHVDITAIEPIERAVLNPDNIKKYKYTETYLTVKKWLDRQISRGEIKTLDENGMMVLQTLYGGNQA